MTDYLREGGWPIYPILTLGTASLLVALRHALIPQRSLTSLCAGLAIATVILGCFGSVVGLQHALSGLPGLPPERRWIMGVGLREALNCFALSLAFAFFSALGATAGAFRMARRIESTG